MNEHEVDRILTRLGQEEFVPPQDLVERTRKRLHRNPLLPTLVAVSIGLQLVVFFVLQVYLFSTQASVPMRVFGEILMVSITIIPITAILIARKKVQTILCRFEAVAGCR